MSQQQQQQQQGVQHGFEVKVSKEDFKFHAAHFVAFDGFREPLHGHNYKVGVRLMGQRVGHDGYLIDFGIVKKTTKAVCKELNNHFICPMKSNVIQFLHSTTFNQQPQVTLTCQDGSIFSFPTSDVAQLPIIHASSEELAIYIWTKILSALNADYFRERGIHTMQITVMEAPGQEARFSWGIPTPSEEASQPLTVDNLLNQQLASSGPPQPCLVSPSVCTDCIPFGAQSMSQQLEQMAQAMQDAGVLSKDGKPLTRQEVEQIITSSSSSTAANKS